jgi:hypothetical protein
MFRSYLPSMYDVFGFATSLALFFFADVEQGMTARPMQDRKSRTGSQVSWLV